MKILIAAGGSGGHVLPALYTAKELKKAGCVVDFISTKGFMSDKVRQEGFSLSVIDAKGMSLNSIGSFFSSAVAMFKAVGQSYRLLHNIKPHVVAGFGGYGAFPVVLVAWLFRCPTLIHEQNVAPGKANSLLSKIAGKIAVSFRESEPYFNKRKTVLTGCPCHRKPESFSPENAFRRFNLRPGTLTILVLGGSQGSHRINRDALKACALLKNELDFQIIHITGPQDYATVKEGYAGLGVTASVFPFLGEIDEAYAVSDLAISRAGAVTVSELALFGLPAILIPYPYAGAHQKENAKILSARGVAVLIEEGDLSPEKLKSEILAIARRKPTKGAEEILTQNIVAEGAANRIALEIMALKK